MSETGLEGASSVKSGTPKSKSTKHESGDKSSKHESGDKIPKGAKGPKIRTVAEVLATSTPGTKPKEPKLPAKTESEMDDEMLKMEAEMRELEEERRLTKADKLKEMQEKLKAKKERVKTLRGKSTSKTSSKEKDGDDETVTLEKLRTNDELKSKVQKILKHLALTDDEGSDEELSSSEDSYFDSDEKSNSDSKSEKQKKKKLKSGINAKAADRVKHPQKWPQVFFTV